VRRVEDPAGSDFPAMVAEKWEMAYAEFQQQCKPEHFSVIRMAVVLSVKGGALLKILAPFRLGFGAVLGNGKQPFNWIHEADASGILAASLRWNGIFNASAPALDNNLRLSQEIARVLKKPIMLPPVPEFVLNLTMGDRASLVLKGNWSDSASTIAAGYRFQFPALGEALDDLLRKEY
jgi:NAD dependent epimerase/dehydratase family enzyme